MFNSVGGHLLDDVVSRVEQSRLAYSSQTEEFHGLNTNLETYLNDLKEIDDENRQLQDSVEQIRTNYISTLENHLKRLPDDFRQQSRTLTEAHIERYKLKSHAKRFVNEREEVKKRINFLANNEKEQMKRLNLLQKHQSSLEKELKRLREQMKTLYDCVENEKQKHREAMNKVDELQIQLEQVCNQRSKTEFEIQTLREELQLMQTAKEFLDEEHQMILSTQTEANEYLLSCLSESISRIREDFSELNRAQIKQVENEYNQILVNLEKNSLENANRNESIANRQRAIQIECEKLQTEHQSMTQELTILNDHNILLSEQIFAMEADLHSIRNERVEDLMTKDNELERSKIELQSLNEKLHHLAEYDRNLKFELTLYRGVLEGEYRRKQQQQQQLRNNQYPIRPTTLRPIGTRNNKDSSAKNEYESIKTDQINNINEQEYSLQQSNEPIPDEDQITSKPEPISPRASPIDQEESSPETPQSIHSPVQGIADAWHSPSSASGVQVYLITAPNNENNKQSILGNVPPILTEVYRRYPICTQLPEESTVTTTEEIESSEDSQQKAPWVQEIEELSRISLASQQIFSDIHKSPLSPTANFTSTSRLITAESQQSLSTESDKQSVAGDDERILEELPPQREEQSEPVIMDGYVTTKPVDFSIENPIEEIELSTQLEYDEKNESTEFTESFTIEEHDIQTTDQQEPLSCNPPTTSLEEIKETNYSIDDNELTLEQDETKAEEPTSFSDQFQIEEESKINYTSSPGYYGTLNDREKLNRTSLLGTSLDDVESDKLDFSKDIDMTSTMKPEEKKSEDFDEARLESIMQDLRCVYSELVNSDELLEINDDFPNNLISRLEFGDNFIRVLFDDLLKKYLVQPAQEGLRLKTLDWAEFRDILFPILSGRYTEKHIRKVFDVLDIHKDGSLSLEQILELTELLQIDNTVEFTNNMMDKYNKTENDTIRVYELIQTMNESDHAKKNILPDEIEHKSWYSQRLNEEENPDSSSISFEVPNMYPTKVDDEVFDMMKKAATLLGRMFRRLGADVTTKQLNSNKQALSIAIINELINNNVDISNDDLHIFIDLFLRRKQNSDAFITWVEFRDTFLPFFIGGMFLKEDISRWFDVFDEKEQKMVYSEQILLLLRLLQMKNSEEVLKKMIEVSETYTNINDNSWRLEELLFALENVEETSKRMLSNNEAILPYDVAWYSKIQ